MYWKLTQEVARKLDSNSWLFGFGSSVKPLDIMLSEESGGEFLGRKCEGNLPLMTLPNSPISSRICPSTFVNKTPLFNISSTDDSNVVLVLSSSELLSTIFVLISKI
jgi:hypothetical protein